MKNAILLTAICTLLLTGAFAQTRSANAASAAAKNRAALDSVQYSLGVYLIQSALKGGYNIDNPAILKKAIDDVLQNRPLMVKADKVDGWLQTYQQVYAQQRGKQLESMVLAQVKGQPGMVSLNSGVTYSIIKTGEGPKPGLRDTVVLNVIGVLADGKVFQDSNKDQSSLIALTADLLPGLRELLQLMPEGSVWHAILPASSAYGINGNGTNIPPNSALIFDIGLVAVKKAVR